MKRKVVFLDVDGTIVNAKGLIPESAKRAIKKAVENGHKLVVCSGRSLFQLPQSLLDLGFSGMVTAAGAQVIADGKEIEVNTSSHRYGLSDLTPSRDILKLYRELGGHILTLGSDSHKPEHLGAFLDETKEELKALGFKEFYTFEKMKPVCHML